MVREPGLLAALACLNEPMRRRFYEHVAASPEPVSREGAAAALGVTRSLAAFHLDKLVDAGLLRVDRRRPEGRTGRGAGRPAKWYSRVPGELSVSVPERHYDLAAELLAEAAERSSASLPMADALREVVRQHGSVLGAELREHSTGRSPTVDDLIALLDTLGYEPRGGEGVVTMANCPFHTHAADHPGLICGMNLHLLEGLVEAAGLAGGAGSVEAAEPGGAAGRTRLTAKLDPAPGRCCVTLVVWERGGTAELRGSGGLSQA